METQTLRTDLWTQEGKERRGGIESSIDTYTLPHAKLAKVNLLYDAGRSNQVLCDNPEG